MRLISKYKDYYDSLFSYDSGDKRSMFLRKKSHYHYKDRLNFPHCSNDKGYVTSGVVGFCGKLYPFLRVYKFGCEADTIYSTYDFLKLYPEMVDNDSKDKLSYYNRSRLKEDTVRNWLSHATCIGGFFTKTIKLTDKNYFMNKIFDEEKVAYFSFSKETYGGGDYLVELYPVLKDLKFYRVFDIHQAYQNLLYYLSNELVKPDDPYIAPVPDHVKAASKGFDQFSFRTEKSVKKVTHLDNQRKKKKKKKS